MAERRRDRTVPVLVCDTSSDFLSRPVPVARYGLLYAGAQKNAGPAGVTVVIVREDLLAGIPDGLPRCSTTARTPSTARCSTRRRCSRSTSWRSSPGGSATRSAASQAQEARNREKASLLYERIDASGGLYRGHAATDSRSTMNVTWRLPTHELDARFVAEAAAEGLVELKGHRSVGGIRASIYNAMPLEGVRALAGFMDDFAGRNG